MRKKKRRDKKHKKKNEKEKKEGTKNIKKYFEVYKQANFSSHEISITALQEACLTKKVVAVLFFLKAGAASRRIGVESLQKREKKKG